MDGACFYSECFECDIFRTITNSAYYSVLPFPYSLMALDMAYIEQPEKIKCSIITQS